MADLVLLIAVLMVVSGARSQHSTVSCSFNAMCSCRTSRTLIEVGNLSESTIHQGQVQDLQGAVNQNQDAVRDVSCFGVPFGALPVLPEGKINHVDIVNSGLVVADLPGSAWKTANLSHLHVESLRLMNNRIRHVSETIFKIMGDDLKSLDLSYNELDELPHGPMRHLRALDWANFHSNCLTSLEGMGSLWSHLSATLNALFLGNNDIVELPKAHHSKGEFENDSLSSLSRLAWLNLDGNHLTELPGEHLPSRLHTLSVASNRISKFPLEMFSTLKDLRWLDLRGNHIRHLPTSSVQTTHKVSLHKLDLGENLIETLPNHGALFNTSLHVRDLYLDFNRISHIPSNAFRGLRIARLYLSSNGITTIDPRGFYSLASSLVLLDLDRNKVSEYPQALKHLRRLRFLYLSDNQLPSLPKTAFSTFGIHLEALNLAANKLTQCPKLALRNTPHLVHLNIGYNNVESLRQDCFAEWGSNLEVLILRGNRISSLPPRLFAHAPAIRELSLSLNRLDHWHNTSLVDVADSLETLELNMAFQTEEFPLTLIKPLRKLQWLSLDSNNFHTLDFGEENILPELRFLSIEGNGIRKLGLGTFSAEKFQFLRDIRLGHNRIEEIYRGTFQNLPELTGISLTSNHLRKLHFQGFNNLPKLITVNLSHNRLEIIERGTFQNLTNLFKIDLQFNKLTKFSWDVFVSCTNPLMSASLNISDNQITKLESSNDPALAYVKVIDLNRNQLTEFPSDFIGTVAPGNLKKLYLTGNQIQRLGQGVLARRCEELQVLELRNNALIHVDSDSFQGAVNLQIIDLSNNRIENLSPGTFAVLPNLRILNLSHNRLRFLPQNLFANTSIETLGLSHNHLSSLPGSLLSAIHSTLLHLDISSNQIEHLDATLMKHISGVITLNLAQNRLTILPDNVFSYLTNLIELDLSFNVIRANFKELFHYLQKVKDLQLAGVGLTKWPHVLLPNLIKLNLSSNAIEDSESNGSMRLSRLRVLDISRNNLKSVPHFLWHHTPLLKELDLSYNPVRTINQDSFSELHRLQVLKLAPLPVLETIESGCFQPLVHLNALYAQSWEGSHLNQLLLGLHGIKRLVYDVKGVQLSNQLTGIAALDVSPKLKDLEITGRHLKTIQAETLSTIELKHLPDCSIAIKHTAVRHLSDTFLHGLEGCAALRLDLRNNSLHTFTSSANGNNASHVTSLVRRFTGGLFLDRNPWICACENYWLGSWLKLWIVETSAARQFPASASESAVCTDHRTESKLPLVELSPVDPSCNVAALSARGTRIASSLSSNRIFQVILALTWIFVC